MMAIDATALGLTRTSRGDAKPAIALNESSLDAAQLQQLARDRLPCRDMSYVSSAGIRLRPKQIPIGEDSGHRIEHICAVIKEVRYPQFTTMHSFFRPPAAEPHIANVKESMAFEPLHRPFLNAFAAFGDDPPLSIRADHNRLHDLDHALIERREQDIFQHCTDE